MFAFQAVAQNTDSDIQAATDKRSATAFESIHINGRFKITLFNSDSYQISVTAPEKLLDEIETKIVNGELNIHMSETSKDKDSSYFDNLKTKYNDYLIRKPVEIRVGAPNLKSIYAKGASMLDTEGTLNLAELNIDFSGATKGDFDCNISGSLQVSLTEASKLDMQGTTSKISITANGASAYNGAKMHAKDAKVNLSGASRAELHATESIDANLSGATKVVCTGSPKSVKQQASRGSSVSIK